MFAQAYRTLHAVVTFSPYDHDGRAGLSDPREIGMILGLLLYGVAAVLVAVLTGRYLASRRPRAVRIMRDPALPRARLLRKVRPLSSIRA